MSFLQPLSSRAQNATLVAALFKRDRQKAQNVTTLSSQNASLQNKLYTSEDNIETKPYYYYRDEESNSGRRARTFTSTVTYLASDPVQSYNEFSDTQQLEPIKSNKIRNKARNNSSCSTDYECYCDDSDDNDNNDSDISLPPLPPGNRLSPSSARPSGRGYIVVQKTFT